MPCLRQQDFQDRKSVNYYKLEGTMGTKGRKNVKKPKLVKAKGTPTPEIKKK